MKWPVEHLGTAGGQTPPGLLRLCVRLCVRLCLRLCLHLCLRRLLFRLTIRPHGFAHGIFVDGIELTSLVLELWARVW